MELQSFPNWVYSGGQLILDNVLVFMIFLWIVMHKNIHYEYFIRNSLYGFSSARNSMDLCQEKDRESLLQVYI